MAFDNPHHGDYNPQLVEAVSALRQELLAQLNGKNGAKKSRWPEFDTKISVWSLGALLLGGVLLWSDMGHRLTAVEVAQKEIQYRVEKLAADFTQERDAARIARQRDELLDRDFPHHRHVNGRAVFPGR